MVSEQAENGERILKITRTLLDVTGDLSKAFTAAADAELKRMGAFDDEDEPPIPPKLVS